MWWRVVFSNKVVHDPAVNESLSGTCTCTRTSVCQGSEIAGTTTGSVAVAVMTSPSSRPVQRASFFTAWLRRRR